MKSNPNIRDAIFPIIGGKWQQDNFAYECLIGTAFLIGRRGYALTAAHVVDQMLSHESGYAAAFVDLQEQWKPLRVVAHENHPTEDVAIIQLGKVCITSG